MVDRATDPQQVKLPYYLRFAISVLIIGHLMAVFLPPFAFQTRGPRGVSPSIMWLLSPVRRYAEFAYLDRGYAFFAPDPGPSHLVRIDPKMDADESPSPRVFPNLDDQWPRLLYHRYFMVSEFLSTAYEPSLPDDAERLIGDELTAEEIKLWRQSRERYDRLIASISHHYEAQSGVPVNVSRIEHRLPDFVGYAERQQSLTDPDLYVVLPDETIDVEAVVAPMQTDNVDRALGRGPELIPLLPATSGDKL